MAIYFVLLSQFCAAITWGKTLEFEFLLLNNGIALFQYSDRYTLGRVIAEIEIRKLLLLYGWNVVWSLQLIFTKIVKL